MSRLSEKLARIELARKEGWIEIEPLPCGCVTGVEVRPGGDPTNPDDRGFGMVPCALDCEYFLYAQGAAARRKMPGEVRMRQ